MQESKVIFEKTFETALEAKGFSLLGYISYEHDQDCCEDVYIDFDHIDMRQPQIESLRNIGKMEIKTAPGDGILVNLFEEERGYGDPDYVSVFLACRNKQNGYYNDTLDLIVEIDGVKKVIELQGEGVVGNIIN